MSKKGYAFQERPTIGVEDMVLLSDITLPAVVKNLQKRFSKDEIYTYIGNVLIVCNPFRWLNLYDAHHVKMYDGANMKDQAPHIFAVADNAFKQMIEEEEKQCCIISGESGAGKTEAAKQIMSFIAAASGSGGNDKAVTKVKNIILDSNPALEAFGNAMTVRNNNSSRFGKYFEIKFESGTPRGGTITNYLLEKSRVVQPGQGERSFHIFYQLLKGADRSMLNDLGLSSNPMDYYLLAGSGVTEINNEGGRKDDSREFQETLSSLETVDIYKRDQMDLFTIVAAVLHLSNITFYPVNVDGAEGSEPSDPNAFANAAHVLAVDQNALHYAICYRTLTTMAPGKGVETYQVPNNPTQAMAAKEALQKEMYERMFSMLVKKINVALETGGNNTRLSMRRMARNISDSGLSIGVLDIYGFEIFDDNRFEQFCINYVNEKLQQIFIDLTIKSEQEDYTNEGIQWSPIPYFDNKTVCDLVEGKRPPGVFAILDDTVKSVSAMGGKQVDLKFLDNLKRSCGGHKHFNSFNSGFIIEHYAGKVSYNVTGFVSANKDAMTQDLQHMIKSSQMPFLQSLFPEEIDVDQRRQPPSASFKLKGSCGDLVYALMDCAPHYVRCIKSNDRKRAGDFDDQRVAHQSQYLGLLENIKVRRAGFAYRVFFDRFIGRFKVIAAGQMDPQVLAYGNDFQIASAILEVATQYVPALQQQGEAQLGKTKLFIKQPETFFALQEMRKNLLNDIVAKIQKTWRRFNLRKDLVNLRTEMADLFLVKEKDATPTDLLRPYYGAYIEDKKLNLAINELLEFYRASEIKQESIQFSDTVERLVGKKFESTVFVVTDQAFYLAKWTMDGTKKQIDAEMKRLAAERKMPAHVRRMQQQKQGAGGLSYKLTLLRRTLLKNITSLSLSHEADDHVMLTVAPPAKVKPDKSSWIDKKKVKRCMESQEPFSFFGKSKHRCHYTGNIYVADLVKTKIPLPDLGYYTPVEVHHSMIGKVSTEPRSDVVLNTEKKAEVAAVLRDLVTRARGGKPAAAFNVKALQANVKPTLPQAKALYDYQAQQSDELTLRAGDIIDLTDTSNPDWWIGKKGGKQGTFPAAYCEKMALAPVKPRIANPNKYMIEINFNDHWTTSFGTDLIFQKDPSAPQVIYKSKGSKLLISVPVGVIGQKLRAIQASQAKREAKREAERQALYALRQENAAKREEERRRQREQRLADKKMKRKAEKDKRDRERDAMNFGKKNAQMGGASFAARIAGKDQARFGSQAPSWSRGGNQGAAKTGTGGGPKFSTYTPPEPKWNKPKAPSVHKPSPWQAFKDDASGSIYYYNSTTQESTWTKPPGFKGKVQG